MTYVITEPCNGVKDASCVEVCPVDCISTTDQEEMYYIDPATCIDCSYCVSVCPVNAIFDEFNIPSEWRTYVQKNREFFKQIPFSSLTQTRYPYCFLPSCSHTSPSIVN